MPRRTTTGKLQVNLTLTEKAYQALQRHADTKKAYGQLLSHLLEIYTQAPQRDEIHARLERLERHVGLGRGELGR
jgi:hypothetical protein